MEKETFLLSTLDFRHLLLDKQEGIEQVQRNQHQQLTYRRTDQSSMHEIAEDESCETLLAITSALTDGEPAVTSISAVIVK